MDSSDLVLHVGTIRSASFQELCGAARAGGFSAITLYPHQVPRARAEGLSDSDLRAILDDHGLRVLDLDPLLSWIPGEEVPPGISGTEEDFYATAEAIGARSINMAQGFGNTIDLDQAAEAMAGVCDRAREHGLILTLEYLPWSGIPDAATALEIVERCGRDNATLMFDAWHTFRGPTTDAQLRAIPPDRIGSLQWNDAPADPADDLVHETLNARLLPGEGDAPLVSWMKLLDEIGCSAPVGLEVFSAELDALPPEEVGRRCGKAMRALLAQANA
jgi:sugar phosphate isomerase/epimerase